MPTVRVIVVTGNATMEVAIAAMRAGAYDFLLKPIDVKLLAPAILARSSIIACRRR